MAVTELRERLEKELAAYLYISYRVLDEREIPMERDDCNDCAIVFGVAAAVPPKDGRGGGQISGKT